MRAAATGPAIRVGPEQSVVWHPLERQQLERDTRFLLDPDFEATLTLAQGQLLPETSFNYEDLVDVSAPALGQPGSYVSIVPGKYRKGITTSDPTWGSLYLPVEEIRPDAFTIEFWLKVDTCAWKDTGGPEARPVSSVGGVQFNISVNSGHLTFSYTDNFQYPAVTTNLQVTLGASPAEGEWGHVAVTLDPATRKLSLYLNGSVVASATLASLPTRHAGVTNHLKLLGGAVDVLDYTLSDLRISDRCRVPGVPIVVGRPTLTVGNTNGGTLNKKLLGTLGVNSTSQSVIASTTAIDEMIAMCTVLRDGLITPTPIKAGSTDGTHPSLGHGGEYSYDWTLVDRYCALLGTRAWDLYLGVMSVPQVLGGSVAPYSAPDLAVKPAQEAGFVKWESSYDAAEYAKIAVDFAHRIKVDNGVPLTYVEVWNEPDLSFFMGGADEAARQANYFTLYDAVATALKAYDATLKVGGPEVSGLNLAWINAFVAYCVANGVPFDFISWHWLDNWSLDEVEQARATADAICATHGHAAVELIVGEWYPVGGRMKGSLGGVLYDADLLHHSFAAGWTARALIALQASNHALACITGGYAPSFYQYVPNGALVATDGTTKWPSFNAFKQWSMMQTALRDQTWAHKPPWLEAVSASGGGFIDVLLASLDWRNYRDKRVDLLVDAADGTPVTVYIVDDAHSSVLEAGSGHQDLESYDGGVVRGGKVTVRVRPRASALVRIG